MQAHTSELFWAFGLFAGLIATAALVNRVRPQHRRRIRRLVVLFVLYLATFGGAFLCGATDEPEWSHWLFVASEVLRAFMIVNVATTVVFVVALPVIGIVLPLIASDLLIGVGYVVATIGVLSQNDVNMTGALVSGAAVSAVLAISLQSTLGNIFGGIALQLDGSIHEGDWIQLENGKQGKVHSVRWRTTIIHTRDWSTIIIPNQQLLQSNIMILGKRDGVPVPQRMWVWFNVDFRFAPSRVIEVVSDAINDMPIENVADEPRPNVVCMDFTKDMRESFATYAVRYWILDLASDDPTNSRVRARVYTALRRAGIPLAVPAHTAFVEMHDDVRQAKHVEREVDKRLEALKTVTIFQSFKLDELRKLAAGMSHVLYTAGERITRQGAVAHWLYVMTNGSAEIRVNEEGNGHGRTHASVAQVKAPDFFGEMGLMTGEPRSADVIATSDVDCFRLGKDTFETVLLDRPNIVHELSSKLATRRVELIAVREGLDAAGKRAREERERETILASIKQFFGM